MDTQEIIDAPKKDLYTIDGQKVVEVIYANGDVEYCTEFLDQFGTTTLRRVPKHKLDLVDGNAEIVSDVSLVLDVDLNYPTMLEKIAQLEGLGHYDDDEDFKDIENQSDDPISLHEVRMQDAAKRLQELRQEEYNKNEEKILRARLDQLIERKQNLAKETSEDKAKEKPNSVSGREEPTEAK
ncbi:MAG: hypothetical protein [Microviridae sp.]|nr:MAG: hypothetical protein [Microviridae sp.]